jgi:cysteinyl-tRNA synthetase
MDGIRLHDTLTRRKQPFRPREAGRAGVYVCGMTVDGAPHLGHARSAVVFDVLVRHLERRGFATTFVRNVTDVDDRILRRAAQEGVAPEEVAERNLAAWRRVTDALGARRPDAEPRVTRHVGDVVALVERLVASGHAYAAGGDVFFDVSTKADYGKLSGRTLEEQQPGEAPDPRKRRPADFALWKAAKPGEPSWPSPWGPGRPGWHVECSAMSLALLGAPFDVHGGGADLAFPHHENEIAQSEAATGVSPVVGTWVHHGMVTVRDEKMAKSAGNALSAESVLARRPREAVRAWFLLARYRSPLEASERAIADADAAVERLHAALAAARGPGAAALLDRAATEVEAALDDDLDTPRALAALFHAGTALREAGEPPGAPPGPDPAAASLGRLLLAASPLGVLRADPAAYVAERRAARVAASGLSPSEVDALVSARDAARRGGDFAAADRHRAALAALGVVLKDGPAGTTWDVRGG